MLYWTGDLIELEKAAYLCFLDQIDKKRLRAQLLTASVSPKPRVNKTTFKTRSGANWLVDSGSFMREIPTFIEDINVLVMSSNLIRHTTKMTPRVGYIV